MFQLRHKLFFGFGACSLSSLLSHSKHRPIDPLRWVHRFILGKIIGSVIACERMKRIAERIDQRRLFILTAVRKA